MISWTRKKAGKSAGWRILGGLWGETGIPTTALSSIDWKQDTVTFTHPYDSSITSYSVYKHAYSSSDVYLSDDSGGSLGFGAESVGEIIASIYHDTGYIPANTNLEFQGEVLGAWSQTGNDTNLTAIGFPALATLTATKIAYFDTTIDELRTYDWDGSDWTQTGNGATITTATRSQITALSATRVAFFEGGANTLATYDWDGSDWTQTGNSKEISGAGEMGLTKLTATRIAFADGSNNELVAYDFDESDWTKTGDALDLSDGGFDSPSLATLSETKIAMAFSHFGSVYIATYKFDGTDWSLDGVATDFGSAVAAVTITALSGKRVAVIDQSTDDLYVYEFDGITWYGIGTALSIGSLNEPMITALSSTVVCFIDAGTADLRTYTLATTWTEIAATVATANDEWEELSVAVTTDADIYDGYRLLVDSSEEYYCFSVTTLLTGYANVNGSCLRIPSDADVFLNAYEDNSWQRSDTAVETRVTQRSKTLTALDAGLVYGDPTFNIVAFTMDAPAKTKGLRFTIANRHYGYGLMANGDLEADSVPAMNSETPADSGNVTWTQSSVVARGGTYSGKMLTTDGAGANQFFHDAGADLHGLAASTTYTLVVWTYVPTTGGPSTITEVIAIVNDVTNTAILGSSYPTLYDTWERHAIPFTIPATCAHIDLYMQIASASSADEFFYVDDVQLYQHFAVTIAGPIENVASYTLGSEADALEIVSDGEKYLEESYHAHCCAALGMWHRDDDGMQTIHGNAVAVYVDADTLAVTVTLPVAFLNIGYQVFMQMVSTTMTAAEQKVASGTTAIPVTTTTFDLEVHADNVLDVGETATFHYMATGRWR